MSRPVEIIQLSRHEWTIGIRDNWSTTENHVVIHVRDAVFDIRKKKFTPKPQKDKLICGTGQHINEVETITIIGTNRSTRETTLFDCTEIQVKHQKYQRNATPKKILNVILEIKRNKTGNNIHIFELPWMEKRK